MILAMNAARRAIRPALWCAAYLFSCAIAQAQYVYVDSVSNSASYFDSDSPGYGIAQGSLMVLFGYDIGPGQLVQSPGFPLPLALGGTSIQVTVNGAALDMPIVYTSSSQVAALLPSSTPTGDGTLILKYNGAASSPVPIRVVAGAFGIYSLASNGIGAGVITAPDYQVKTLAAGARPGEILVLWGTGLGPVPGNDAAGALPGNLFPATEVYVGNKRAKVSYAGRSGCCAGLDQITFEVPAGVQGCYVPVAVRTPGTTSNFVSLPVSPDGGTCAEPVGLPADLLRSAQAGKDITVGAVVLGQVPVLQAGGFSYSRQVTTLLSSALGTKVTENQARLLLQATGAERRKAAVALLPKRGTLRQRLARLAELKRLSQGLDQEGSAAAFGQLGFLTPLLNQFGELFPSSGGCTVYTDTVRNTQSWSSQRQGLDAGPEILLSGPLGTRTLGQTDKGQYQTSFGGGFTGLPAGTYTASAIGGADVGPFSAPLQVTGALHWTNKSAAGTVNRTVPLDVIWSAGNAESYVVIGGTAKAQVSHPYICSKCGPGGIDVTYQNYRTVSRAFACVEDVRKGIFTIPEYVLGALPAGENTKAYMFLAAHPLQNRFSAPGLNIGFIADLSNDGSEVVLR